VEGVVYQSPDSGQTWHQIGDEVTTESFVGDIAVDPVNPGEIYAAVWDEGLYKLVGESPIEAAFTASPTSGVAPLTTVSTNTSSGDYIAQLWNFGDGMTSVLESPTHTYATPGVYTPALTVSGPGGSDSLTRASYITACHWADVNQDWQIDVEDIQMVARAWRCRDGDDCYDPGYDFDADGTITVVDIMRVAAEWGWNWP
jgi:PKD repeat protein